MELSKDDFIDISKDEAQKGDYVYSDGLSGFCYGGYEKIKEISVRYNPKTGEPYKIVKTEAGTYRYDDGWSIKGALAYRIFSYHRRIKRPFKNNAKEESKPKRNEDDEYRCLYCAYFGTEFCACIGSVYINTPERKRCTKFLKVE